MPETNAHTITDGKYVEATYLVRDSKTGAVLTEISRPGNYVHGVNEIFSRMIARYSKARREVIGSVCSSTAMPCMVGETRPWSSPKRSLSCRASIGRSAPGY